MQSSNGSHSNEFQRLRNGPILYNAGGWKRQAVVELAVFSGNPILTVICTHILSSNLRHLFGRMLKRLAFVFRYLSSRGVAERAEGNACLGQLGRDSWERYSLLGGFLGLLLFLLFLFFSFFVVLFLINYVFHFIEQVHDCLFHLFCGLVVFDLY